MNDLEQAVKLLNENPGWKPDFDSIRDTLVFWMEFTSQYGPLEQAALDLARDIISEFDNDITVNIN